jgi:hypothetical protein
VVATATSALTDADSALWRTLRGLTLDPGKFAREYVDGKRAGRFTPARYLIVTFAVTMIVNRMAMPSLGPPIAPDTPNYELMVEAQAFILRYLQVSLFGAIPAGALTLRMLYRSTGRNFAECCALLAYTLGHVSVIGLLLLPLGRVDYWAWAGAGWALQFGFTLWASKRFFDLPWLQVTWRTLVVVVVFALASGVLGMVMMLVFLLSKLL